MILNTGSTHPRYREAVEFTRAHYEAMAAAAKTYRSVKSIVYPGPRYPLWIATAEIAVAVLAWVDIARILARIAPHLDVGDDQITAFLAHLLGGTDT
ncbi:MAG: hypothetical protein ACRD0P_06310 [Stackebrandtia sp.]